MKAASASGCRAHSEVLRQHQLSPGWSLATVYLHVSAAASGNVAASREVTLGRFNRNINIDLNVNLKATPDLLAVAPTYVFGTPILGGQLAVSLMGILGRPFTALDGTLTLTGPNGGTITRQGEFDTRTAFGDLYPQASLKWNAGVHNFMTYVTGDIPVGAYDPTRLANVGIGHGAIDGGGGYTYFNPATGHEFSAVAGFTYNFKNQRHEYQNGDRLPHRLGRIAVPLQAGSGRPRRLRLSAAHRRAAAADLGEFRVARGRHRPADRVICSRSATCRDIST